MTTITRLEPYFDLRSFGIDSEEFWIHHDIVCERYRELEFLGENEDLVDAYDNSEARYYLLRDPHGQIAGTFRMVRPLPEVGLPFHSVYPEFRTYDWTQSCESTRVVAVQGKSAGASTNHVTRCVLFETVVHSLAFAEMNGLPNFVSLGTPVILRWINRTFRDVQQRLGEARYHHGGDVIPCCIDLSKFEQRTRTQVPYIWEYFREITKLEQV